MQIVVDFTKCTGLGICESIAPDFFEVDGGALVLVTEDVTDDELQSVEDAVAGCPTEALRIATVEARPARGLDGTESGQGGTEPAYALEVFGPGSAGSCDPVAMIKAS